MYRVNPHDRILRDIAEGIQPSCDSDGGAGDIAAYSCDLHFTLTPGPISFQFLS